MFAASWNGVALFPSPMEPMVEFASDTSGSWDGGAWCEGKRWQLEWPKATELGVAFKDAVAT